jgi:hypothetical protein
MAGWQAGRGKEKIRDLIRRLLWLMNDESGGIGWRAPEMIGEILVRVPDLIKDFFSLLPAYFDEEPFERGSRFAVYRVAAVFPEILDTCRDRLKKSLSDPDPQVRAYAVLALSINRSGSVAVDLSSLYDDDNEILLYDFDSGVLIRSTVGRVAQNSVEGNSAFEQTARIDGNS